MIKQLLTAFSLITAADEIHRRDVAPLRPQEPKGPFPYQNDHRKGFLFRRLAAKKAVKEVESI